MNNIVKSGMLAALVWIASAFQPISAEPGASEQYSLLMQSANDWLLDHDDPTLASLGLMRGMLTLKPGEAKNLDTSDDSRPAELLLAQLERLLERQPEAAGLQFLAEACEERNLMDSCKGLGLEAAVEQRDPSNLITWALLAEGKEDAMNDALLRSNYATSYFGTAIKGYFQAYRAVNQQLGLDIPLANLASQAIAVAGTSALSILPLRELNEHCRLSAAKDLESVWTASCHRAADYLRHSEESLTTKGLGYSIAKNLAESQQQAELAATYASEWINWQRWYMCHINQTMEIHTRSNEEFAIRWLELNTDYGEVGGMKRIGEEMNISCDAPPTEV